MNQTTTFFLTTLWEIIDEMNEYSWLFSKNPQRDFSRNSKEAVIAYLLESCGARDNAIMVGDTAYDVLGAKAHGIPTVGVSWGYGLVADMELAGAIGIANTMDELYEYLSK